MMVSQRITSAVAFGLVVAAPASYATTDVLTAARIGQTLAALTAIVAVIFGLAYLIRRVPGFTARTGNALKIADALSVGTRERILLIEIDGERLLVGVTPGRIQPLHILSNKIREANTFEAALLQASGGQAGML